MRTKYHLPLAAVLFSMAAASQAQSVAPAGVTLKPSQTQLFSIQNAARNRYFWSVYPSLGTITATGLYTAPATVTATSTVGIYAIAPGQPALSATVTLKPLVSISVSPSWISMTNGQSAAFTASITGASDTSVTWSSPSVGAVTPGGVYTVPATLNTPQNVIIIATSVVDPSKAATATIALLPTISVALKPTSNSLTEGQSTSLNGTVTGTSNTAITWSLSPQVGTVSNGVYTAPSPITSAQTVTVTAISQASTGRTASAVLSLVPVSIAVTPPTASLTSGQSATLTATVNGTGNTGVNWTLTPGVGTVTNGVYTAPALVTTAQVVTVTATSAADSTRTASSLIWLTPSVSITLTPSAASLTGGQSTTLKATVTGSSNTGVNWSMSPSLGTLSNGVYTAPATIASAQTVTVTAASASDPTKSLSAKISLVPVSISISPSTASLKSGQSATLKATVSGSGNTGVNWSLSPSVGTVTNGVYTAPATIASAQNVTVTATSAADATKSASATVSLVATAPAVSISVTPSTASLTGGKSATFAATVTGSSNTSVNWSMTPSLGTLSNGVYTAPATIASAQTVTVKATSAADATKSDSATVSLVPAAPAVSISVTPSTASLTGGQSATFAATVMGSSNTSVNWSMTPSLGTLSNGVYTAPATIASAQTVTVKATSAADATKSASATVSLVPAAPSVSISVTPSTASLTGGQSATFAGTVSGTSNLGVNWSVAPPVGTVTNGVYTAPPLISLQQTVTVAAISAADPTKIAHAVVTLVPTISVAVLPSSATLTDGQSMQFNVSLSGTTNPNVTWSFSPALGTLSAGLYQAPATINSQQNITVTATSLADPTKTSSATIALVPSVGIALTPSSISLTGGQSTQFNVTIGGTSSTAVTWALAPPVGNITNGVYTAPVTIDTLQTIILTVASAVNPTQTATATITLTASTAPSTSVSPTVATLGPSQKQQFTASGLGTNPKWAIRPATGSITTGGLYAAPSSILTQSTVTVTATSATDSTKAASATVTLKPAAGQTPPPTSITLPIEVLGPDGTTATVSFNIPTGTNLSGLNLWMKIHGLRSQTQASLQLNGSGWQPISEDNVTLLGLANAYGGIGGGFHTLQMTMPASSLTTGANTLQFQFNGTDGRVSGFRVLEFNVQDANGNSLIPSSTFVYDDPNSWQPPSANPSDIAAGQTLWRTAELSVPSSSGPATIKAHCMDCHAQDGRDLKYFNYSNTSIHARSVFHGLTAQQGDQIASYIRSLGTPNPGRPWNPPYQPGPGLDEQPVTNWSAGAGLDAVVDSDAEMLKAMFPTGVQPAYFSPTGHVNMRETQIAMQLPDWNTWLPIVHPMDAWPDFLTSSVNLRYGQLRAGLQAGGAAAYASGVQSFDEWNGNYTQFVVNKTNAPASSWTLSFVNKVYSTPLWTLVKTWELNQEFGLEGLARTVFLNPNAEDRAWRSGIPFMTSPNILHIPRGSTVFENGRLSTWVYAAFIWYHTQLILNNSEYEEHGAVPIDWGYSYAKIEDLSQVDSNPQAALFTLWQTKGAQLSNNGYGPDNGNGWQWQVTDISRLVTPALRNIWIGTPLATRTAIYQGLVTTWLAEVQQFTPQQFYNSKHDGIIRASQVPGHFLPDSPNLVDRVWAMIPRFRYFGVNQTQINQLAAWAQSIWPNGGWAATATATCAPADGAPTVTRCSTDK